MTDQRDAGSPWPGAANGEILSPSGRRSYSSKRAAALTGLSERRIRGLVGTELEGERERTGWKRVFVDAGSLEAYIAERRQPDAAVPVRGDVDWHELFRRQGQDLEQTRLQLSEVRAEAERAVEEGRALRRACASLRLDNDDLKAAVHRLSSILQRGSGSTDIEPPTRSAD